MRDSDSQNLLIVDDEAVSRLNAELLISTELAHRAPKIIAVASKAEALEVLRKEMIHVMLLDKKLGPEHAPDSNGIQMMPEFLAIQPHLQIIVLTASERTQDVVQAIRDGAFNFVRKSQDEHALLVAQVDRALRIAREMAELSKRQATTDSKINASSQVMQEVLSAAQISAQNERPLLLKGEAGVGKRTLAKSIHQLRREHFRKPNSAFFSINLGMLNDLQLEKELFGGDASSDKVGRLQRREGILDQLHGGTLYIEGIGDASQATQHLIESLLSNERIKDPTGKREHSTRFKLICSTSCDLREQVQAGTFRKELFVLLAPFQITMPSLPERKEDLPGIIQSLLPKVCEELGINPVSIHALPEALIEHLKVTPFEGNIPALEAILLSLLQSSPKDKQGRPNFNGWKARLSQQLARLKASGQAFDPSALTLEDLLSRRLDVLGPDFPGLSEFLDRVADRVIMDARPQYKSLRALAKALDVAPSGLCQRMKRIDLLYGARAKSKKRLDRYFKK